MNIQRFRQVLAFIEKHPERWDQRACATCFLAHAARMHGREQHAGFGNEFVGVVFQSEEWSWLIDIGRTLDDFSTVARRPFS